MKHRRLLLLPAACGLAVLTACSAPAPQQTAPRTTTVQSSAAAPESAIPKFPTFDPIVKKGSGDALIALPEGVTAGLITAKVKETDYNKTFTISALDSKNKDGGALIDTYGEPYTGTTSFGSAAFLSGDESNPTTRFRVKANKPWTITIHPLNDAPTEMPTEGKGDAIYLVEKPVADTAVTFKGSGNFQIDQTDFESGETTGIVNEIDSYKGLAPFQTVPSLIRITADGDGKWTVKPQS